MRRHTLSGRNALVAHFDRLTRDMRAHTGLRGLGSGFPWLDETIDGMQPGDVIVVGGKPGAGKSSFMAYIMANLARMSHDPWDESKKTKLTLVYFDLETSVQQIVSRLLLQLGSVTSRLPNKDEETWASLTRAAAQLAEADIQLSDTRYLKPSQIETILRDIADARGFPYRFAVPGEFVEPQGDKADELGSASPETTSPPAASDSDLGRPTQTFVEDVRNPMVVFIDSLQEILPDHFGQTRDENVCGITSNLKTLARGFGCPIVVSSRLSRRWDARRSPVPQIQDLRDSGSIEDVADVVILLDRGESDGVESETKVNIRVVKNRRGPRREYASDFDPLSGRFGACARNDAQTTKGGSESSNSPQGPQTPKPARARRTTSSTRSDPGSRA